MLYFYFLLQSIAQTTITIRTGALAGTQANSATGDGGPMYRSAATSNFVFSRHHYLYTAAELSAANLPSGNTITKLAWRDTTTAATNGPCVFRFGLRTHH
ncbi:MAG: hypothetical protein IPP29_22920 [Bacteroidetes bacterium]|nr:hypothetical protein [Bacteroidota bacterium]